MATHQPIAMLAGTILLVMLDKCPFMVLSMTSLNFPLLQYGVISAVNYSSHSLHEWTCFYSDSVHFLTDQSYMGWGYRWTNIGGYNSTNYIWFFCRLVV